MKKYILLVTIFFGVSAADAQVRRRTTITTDPAYWFSAGIGLYGGNEIGDGKTNSTWDFGEGTAWQFRAAAEKALQNQFSLGAVLTYVNLPFVYRGPACAQCNAHMDLSSLGASFHAGGGTGLHQVLEVSAGALMYRNLHRDDNGAKLEPTDGNIDPFFTFGYGFGYTFNPTMQLSLVQDYGLALHERTSGQSNAASNTLQQRTTRLNFRMGFGSRTRRR